ncbi:mitotic checkpoint regulator, MAD2B-interacting-domain-containing protein [Hypoxylon fuscum]|nr:mitotic checkpoint regulator, MAD2B-interacting-domain-containing protein [Hypoxylon fuscum]
MGLVDYSDSESDSEAVAKPAPPSQPAPAAGSKKPFQKIIDRSQPGKIRVNLAQSASRDESKATDGGDEPPAKRVRVAGRGGGAFGGFNSLLPPPKNAGKPAVSSSSGKPAPRPGINLKTGAAPGFSREVEGGDEGGVGETATNGGDADASMKQPSIPAEQKPADEVKLVGKPLMFKPLSVSRKPGKKNGTKSTATASKTATVAPTTSAPASVISGGSGASNESAGPPPPKKQKISLFSIPDETAEPAEKNTPSTGVYEPMFAAEATPADEFAAYDAQYTSSSSAAEPRATTHSQSESLDAIAADMNLSASARRELFGRGGVPDAATSSSRVISFDTDKEYAHNEALRAAGQQQVYNPVRGISSGKHSLRQLVSQAQTQKEALEESFAKGKSNRDAAGSRYGWR